MKKGLADKIISLIIFFVVICMLAVVVVLVTIAIKEFNNSGKVEAENFEYTGEINANEKTTSEEEIKTPEIVENPIDEIDESKLKNIDYSNVQVDKYFFNQLEEQAKTIYKAFESNKENMKSGTYQIELGTNFTNVLSKENGQELLGEYYQSAIEAYMYDNPDMFYISPNKMYLNIETTTRGNKTTYNVYLNSGNLSNYYADGFTSEAQINNAISQIQQVKNEITQNASGNAYEDIKMVHDYLVDNLKYDSTLSKSNIYDLYGALVNKECVCEGYARAFKYLMDDLKIPCVIIVGTATNSQGQTENHAWNYVQLNGNWYAVDTTWDDPVIIGGGSASEESKYRYFLKGRSEINKDHIENHQFTEGGKEFNYPNLNEEDYKF